jgi:hypothetical protein
MPERFWNKVNKSGGEDSCWTWTASTDGCGYGEFRQDERIAKAHRISWELANGSIPEGSHIIHTCDNPPCVNPRHLVAADMRTNMLDMWSKGRHPCINGNRKLTDDQVKTIRERIATGESLASIGKHYKVSAGTIWFIKTGWNYKHVT